MSRFWSIDYRGIFFIGEASGGTGPGGSGAGDCGEVQVVVA